MKKYMTPEAETIILLSADCITTSPTDLYDDYKDEIDFGNL